MAKVIALVGSESLLGRELQEIAESMGLGASLKPVADDVKDSGKLVRVGDEPAVLFKLEQASLIDADAIILAGSAVAAKTTLDMKPGVPVIDLTYTTEEDVRARLRAPSTGADAIPGQLHTIAHPAAIAIATVLGKIHELYPIERAIVNIFEPASERGAAGVDELQQQTISLLSFQSLPKKLFDAQLSFNMLAQFGEEAAYNLAEVESRIERHLASLLAGEVPMPSLRLMQAPVFHGYAMSFWVEFLENPGAPALRELLGAWDEAPNNVGIAGQSGIAAGAIAEDRNDHNACWLWIVLDNLRLSAENAIAVARELL